MTKPIDILIKGVKQWNQWRLEEQSVKIDLSGIDLSGQNLESINFSKVNLRGSNLSGTFLRASDFFGANLQSVNFSGAFIEGGRFLSANLKYANLSRANLHGADLSRVDAKNAIFIDTNLHGAISINANFSEANFSYSNFEYAFFKKVILSKVNFRNSVFGSTVFAFSDLNQCINTETILLKYPCSIDISTLRISIDIPKELLGKFGLTESQIEYVPEFVLDEGVQLYPCFLSHTSKDKKFTIPLYEKLFRRGVNVWYDDKKIKPGDIIREEIHKGVSLYDKMILICSKDSLSSWWVEEEIDRYEEKERDYWKQHGEKISLIIPIAIDDEVFTSNNAVAPNLRKRNIADFRHWSDEGAYERAFEKLLAALNVNRGGDEPISYLKQ